MSRLTTCLFSFSVLVLSSTTSLCRAEPSLKIGVVTGLSGIASKYNHYQNNGARLAAAEFNGRGTPVELIFEDSQSIGSKAISAFNKLVEFDRVDAVVGADFGFAMSPLIPLAARRKKLLVTLTLPQESYCRQSQGFFFSVSGKYELSKKALLSYLDRHPEIKRVAMFIFDDPEWGGAYNAVWSEVAKERGLTVTDTFVTSELLPDYRLLLSKALSKKPDLLMLAHEPTTFSRAVLELGFKGPIFSANNYLEVLASTDPVGPAVNQVTIVDAGISPEFSQKYRAQFNEPPILEAYLGYEAVTAIVKAFQADREHPERGVRSLAYPGIAGEIDFRGPGCAGNFAKWALFRIDGREVVPAS